MRVRLSSALGHFAATTFVAASMLVPATVLVSPDARAQESAEKPQIMMEPGDYLDVVDAFDDDNDDPYDFNFQLQFNYLSKRARILRESSQFEPGLTTGGFTSKLQNVGEYVETTSRLTPRADFGIYKDLALIVRLPIVLENSRRIDPTKGTDNNVPAVLNGAPSATPGGAPETLFMLPFESPTRSGIEYLAVGIDWGIFNQARDITKPTWIFGVEGRFSIGEPMRACNANPTPGQRECAHPGDINRDGVQSNEFESAAIEERSAGITRGTVGIDIHSRMSKRIKYIEPYGGFQAVVEVPYANTEYEATSFEGSLVSLPPVVGTVLVGMMIHPWEDREDFGRLTFDLRFQGEYHSEGRDYSELFDALGSSDAPSLRNPRWSRYRDACPGGACEPKSVVDQGSEKSYFTGLAVVEPYGSYRGSGSVTWRAGKYVRLNAGVGIRFDQAHGISHDQPCNPDFQDDIGASGPCRNDLGGGRFQATGVPNSAYRRTINEIGRRFYVDQSITYEVFASGTVMF